MHVRTILNPPRFLNNVFDDKNRTVADFYSSRSRL
jgi:hypothetical protein